MVFNTIEYIDQSKARGGNHLTCADSVRTRASQRVHVIRTREGKRGYLTCVDMPTKEMGDQWCYTKKIIDDPLQAGGWMGGWGGWLGRVGGWW